jgi:hypothetical protein
LKSVHRGYDQAEVGPGTGIELRFACGSTRDM